MIKITIFKDSLRYEADLIKSAETFGLKKIKKNVGKVWKKAKEVTSSIDYVQKINTSDLFDRMKPAEQSDVAYTIGHDIACGRGFKVELV